MTDSRVNFLNIPVVGEGGSKRSRPNQRPIEELVEMFNGLLNDPEIAEFGWTQYTPYFNDGDTCIFRANGFWVRTVTDASPDEDDINYDHYDYYKNLSLGDWDVSHPTLGKKERKYNQETREYESEAYEGPDEARYDRCRELGVAIDSGAFDDSLLEKFGDHCQITVNKEKVTVDFYEHD